MSSCRFLRVGENVQDGHKDAGWPGASRRRWLSGFVVLARAGQILSLRSGGGNMKNVAGVLFSLFGVFAARQVSAQNGALTPAQQQLREVYRELVEINTTDSAGNCTAAAEAMAARLTMAGFSAKDM